MNKPAGDSSFESSYGHSKALDRRNSGLAWQNLMQGTRTFRSIRQKCGSFEAIRTGRYQAAVIPEVLVARLLSTSARHPERRSLTWRRGLRQLRSDLRSLQFAPL